MPERQRDTRFDGLRARLAGVLALVLLPAAALILNGGFEARRQAEAQARLDVEQSALVLATHFEELASGAHRLLASLAVLPEIRRHDPQTTSALLAELLQRNPEFANLGIVLPDGSIPCSAAPYSWPVTATDKPWFQAAWRTRGFAVGEYQVGRITRQPVLVFAQTVLDDAGEAQSVLFAAFDLRTLQDCVEERRPSSATTLLVTDRNGVVLATSDPGTARGEPLSPAHWPAVDAPERGTRPASSSSERVQALRTVGVAGDSLGYVLASVPADLAFAPARRTLWRHLGLLALSAAVVLVVAFLGLEALVVRPVKALVRAADRIAAGDLTARAGVAEGPGEVAKLAHAFDHMAATLQQQERDAVRAQVALRSSEARLRRIVDSGMVGILFWSADGSVLEANEALLHMVGYTREDLLAGSVRWDRLTPAEYAPLDARGLEQIRRTGVCDPFEKEYLHKDGRRVPILIGGASTDAAGRSGVAFVVDISKRKQAEEDLRHSQQLLRALSARLQGVREAERKHLSREIHDELGQGLTGVKLDLLWLDRHLAAGDAESRSKIDTMSRSIDALIQTVRAIATELRPGVLDELGLAAAIEWQAREFEERTGIACDGAADLPEVDLDDARRTALFRIFQETLTNVARHAQATRVRVRLERAGDDVELEIRDDGRGLPPDAADSPTSIGLAGMRERAHLVGGEFAIDSAPGAGTTVRVRVPMGPAAASGDAPANALHS